MSEERKVEKAMNKGLVDVVERLLGDPPTHMYDYGIQLEWKKRAYQWIADQRRPEAIYPVHAWSAGYGGPQSPITWFRCKTCGKQMLGSPHELPTKGCWGCMLAGSKSEGWEVADPSEARFATLRASEGMSDHSIAKVLDGPQ